MKIRMCRDNLGISDSFPGGQSRLMVLVYMVSFTARARLWRLSPCVQSLACLLLVSHFIQPQLKKKMK